MVAALLLLGTGLVVYPLVGNWAYDRRAEQVVATYDEGVAALAGEDVEREFDAARRYNESLERADVVLTDPFDPSTVDDVPKTYDSIFDVSGDGVMAYLEIPRIEASVPVYHGTSGSVLQEGAGHMANTSIPTGDPGTHAVIAGHTGLPNAKIFTDLPQLEEGDVFYLHVMGRTLAYEVDQIAIVEPNDTSELGIVEGREYVTLLTCYPYGINSQRLLVRGTGVPYERASEVAAEPAEQSVWESEYLRAIALCLAVYVPLTVVAVVVVRRLRRSNAR